MNDKDAALVGMNTNPVDGQALLRADNERYLRVVVGAALQDLAQARREHGAGTAAWRERVRQILAWFSDSLESVLQAAQAELERRERESER